MARLRGRKEFSSARKPSGSVERRVARQPRQHDVRRRLGPVAVPALDPAHALAAQPAAGRDAQRRLVVGLDLGLDPPVPQPPRARSRTARSRPASAPPGWRTPARGAPGTAPTTARPRPSAAAARRRCPRPASRRPRSTNATTDRSVGVRRAPVARSRAASAPASPRPAASRTSARSPRRGPPRPPRRPRRASGRSVTTPSVSVGCSGGRRSRVDPSQASVRGAGVLDGRQLFQASRPDRARSVGDRELGHLWG